MKEGKRVLNDDIRAKKVQVITDNGENLWEMSLDEAKSKAKTLWLDLMLIWQNWDVSIIKMLDYGKHLYRLKKQQQKNKQNTKAPDLKTIRITFKIWDNDLQIRKKQALKFAEKWHPLKVTLMLRGRENHYSDLAYEKMNTFAELLSEVYKIDGNVKRHWNNFIAMFKPIK